MKKFSITFLTTFCFISSSSLLCSSQSAQLAKNTKGPAVALRLGSKLYQESTRKKELEKSKQPLLESTSKSQQVKNDWRAPFRRLLGASSTIPTPLIDSTAIFPSGLDSASFPALTLSEPTRIQPAPAQERMEPASPFYVPTDLQNSPALKAISQPTPVRSAMQTNQQPQLGISLPDTHIPTSAAMQSSVSRPASPSKNDTAGAKVASRAHSPMPKDLINTERAASRSASPKTIIADTLTAASAPAAAQIEMHVTQPTNSNLTSFIKNPADAATQMSAPTPEPVIVSVPLAAPKTTHYKPMQAQGWTFLAQDPVDTFVQDVNTLQPHEGYISHGSGPHAIDAQNRLQKAILAIGEKSEPHALIAATSLIQAMSPGNRFYAPRQQRHALRRFTLNQQKTFIEQTKAKQEARLDVIEKEMQQKLAQANSEYLADCDQACHVADRVHRQTYQLGGPLNIDVNLVRLARKLKELEQKTNLLEDDAKELARLKKLVTPVKLQELHMAVDLRAQEAFSDDETDYDVFPQPEEIATLKIERRPIASLMKTEKSSESELSKAAKTVVQDYGLVKK